MKYILEKIKNRKLENYYYVAFALIILAYTITINFYSMWYRLPAFAGGIVLFIIIAFGNYTKRDYCVCGLFLLYGMYLYIKAGNIYLFFYLLLFVSAKNINLDKLCRINLVVWVCILVAIMIFATLGIIEHQTKPVTEINELGEKITTYIDSYGWNHPNGTYALWFHCVLLYIYVRFKHLKWFDFFITGIPMLLLYLLLQCRTGFLSFALLWFMIVYAKIAIKHPKFEKNLMAIFLLVIPVCLFASLLLPYLWANNKEMWDWLNQLFTGRIALSYRYFEQIDISLFGSSLDGVSGCLDNTYARYLLEQGLVIFILLIIGLSAISYLEWKNKHWEGLIVFSVVLIYGIMEAMLLHKIIINPFLILLLPVIFQYREDENTIY